MFHRDERGVLGLLVGGVMLTLLNKLFCFAHRDKGMKHMVGKNWRELFDMVIVQADKPSFFTDRRKYVSSLYCTTLDPMAGARSGSHIMFGTADLYPAIICGEQTCKIIGCQWPVT